MLSECSNYFGQTTTGPECLSFIMHNVVSSQTLNLSMAHLSECIPARFKTAECINLTLGPKYIIQVFLHAIVSLALT